MRGSPLFLCVFSVSCWMNLMPTAGDRIFHFGACRVSISMTEIRAGFTAIKANIVSICQAPGGLGEPLEPLWSQQLHSSDRCCITYQLFTFYVDKVFKHCRTEDSFVNRKISSIANSFLSTRRKLGQCREQNNCLCGEESTEKFKQILANYEGLNVTSAAMKSLGELDILLDWMEKSR
uniref:Interleukin 19 n=1 Tax=Taeniopygia guttata TaxID=59729 RepID=H0YS51_TAEGU